MQYVRLFVPKQMHFFCVKKMMTATKLCKFRCTQLKFCYALA